MNFGLLDKWLSAAKDWHLPICTFMFVVGSVIHWLHGIDASYVAFTATIVGGVTGHAFSNAGKPDDTGTTGEKG